MKVLLVKMSSLGDIVHSFPVIDYLQSIFKEVSIDWVVEKNFSSLVQAHPFVQNVIEVDTKKWRRSLFSKMTWQSIWATRKKLQKTNYDLVFDLQGNSKSGLILSLVKAKKKVGFSYQSAPEWPNTLFTHERFTPPPNKNIREDYLAITKGYFQDQESFSPVPVVLTLNNKEKELLKEINKNIDSSFHPLLLIAPGSTWENKVASLESLQDLLSLILKDYPQARFLFSWGSDQEREKCKQLALKHKEHSELLPNISLPLLQHIMERVDCVVAMDSLPLHLAATTSTSTFSLFGPSLAKKYAPIGSQHLFFQGVCPYGRTFNKRCPVLRTCPTGACVKDVSGVNFYQTLKSLFN